MAQCWGMGAPCFGFSSGSVRDVDLGQSMETDIGTFDEGVKLMPQILAQQTNYPKIAVESEQYILATLTFEPEHDTYN